MSSKKSLKHCKFCGECKSLIKSHIIPRSFYKELRGDFSKPYSIYLEISEKEKIEKYYQAGIYDAEIVCEECEKLFCPFDQHGQEVLKNALDRKDIQHDETGFPVAYKIDNADYTKLKLFALSMLWRANASSHRFFSHVDLGNHEAVLRSYIFKGIAPPAERYSVAFTQYSDEDFSEILIPPWRHRLDSINIYRFYLPSLTLLISVDKRPTSLNFQRIAINERGLNYIYLLPGSGSSETRYMKEAKKQFGKYLKLRE